MGEKMLRPARNFLMVPLALNQLCLFSCWVFRKSLLRCFHCWDVNIPRILGNQEDWQDQAKKDKERQLISRLRDYKADFDRMFAKASLDMTLAYENTICPKAPSSY